MNRRTILDRLVLVGGQVLLLWNSGSQTTVSAFPIRLKSSNINPILMKSSSTSSIDSSTTLSNNDQSSATRKATIPTKSTVMYEAMELDMMEEFGVTIPIACWFPTTTTSTATTTSSSTATPNNNVVQYQHRISVRRIGQLLAGWNFIPEFVSKKYQLVPTAVSSLENSNIVIQQQVMDDSYNNNNNKVQLVEKAPVIFFTHGYLGSRFDMSHIAEELCSKSGYICIAPEYPESLAASYERIDGLDRSIINQALLSNIQSNPEKWNNIQPTAYGVIGHSLGCGTAIQMGNNQWARILISGYPMNRDGTPLPYNNLFISSNNDSLARGRIDTSLLIKNNYQILNEHELPVNDEKQLPRRTALFFDRPDGPNHISFLCEGANNAMIDFLSPLLPLAQALSIPVLDFDKYQISRDSAVTASIVIPLIRQYLQQEIQSQIK